VAAGQFNQAAQAEGASHMQRNETLFMEQIASRIRDGHPDWEMSPHGFGFQIRIAGHGNCGMYLGNLFRRIQCQPDREQVLTDDFIREFERAVAERREVRFEDIRPNLFLAVRAADMEDNVGKPIELAFRHQITPDLAIYWAIDQGRTLHHISKTMFQTWGIDADEVTRIAYENSVAEEKDLSIESIADVGAVVRSRSRFGSVGHLLYRPSLLQNLIAEHVPSLKNQPLLLAVPMPWTITLARLKAPGLILGSLEATMARCGQILSPSTYILDGDQITGKVIASTTTGIEAIPLSIYGLGNDGTKSKAHLHDQPGRQPELSAN
jgi:hypothetical protein